MTAAEARLAKTRGIELSFDLKSRFYDNRGEFGAEIGEIVAVGPQFSRFLGIFPEKGHTYPQMLAEVRNKILDSDRANASKNLRFHHVSINYSDHYY